MMRPMLNSIAGTIMHTDTNTKRRADIGVLACQSRYECDMHLRRRTSGPRLVNGPD